MNPFIETITSDQPDVRDRPLADIASGMTPYELASSCSELDAFRKSSGNLYYRVRACLFLYAAYRFYLLGAGGTSEAGYVPQEGFHHLLERRFEEAIAVFLQEMDRVGPSGAIYSALAASYHQLSFQILADQVRRSVRATRGNQWMFRVAHADDHTIRVRPSLARRSDQTGLYPVLVESTPVRLDLSHSGWSDIFFLGMDYPEGARVLNLSVDLGVHGRDEQVSSPIQSYFRVIPEPLVRLTSIDLAASRDVTDLGDMFNFGSDYLGLLKAGVIASGVIPPSFENSRQTLAEVLSRIVGPDMGFELVTNVNDIPKGSRLAVSTNLLAGMIALLMRATGQAQNLEGTLSETERRIVASRAILGEWLGGSGGGWQDSGGIWPGMKLIEGALAQEGDPEFGVSKGRLLPRHTLLTKSDVHPEIDRMLTQSLVVVHGGLAQNVGPILEMVTERYLLRQQPQWDARLSMRALFDDIVMGLREGSPETVAKATFANWNGPLKTIIPWVASAYTEAIIESARQTAGDDFLGFLMLGGMSGGGMGMFVRPERSARFRDEILAIMRQHKSRLEHALPFAIDPLVYNFALNPNGSVSGLLEDAEALLPGRYYGVHLPVLARGNPADLTATRRAEIDLFTSRSGARSASVDLLQSVVSSLFRVKDSASHSERLTWDRQAQQMKAENGFDPVWHEQIRADLRSGRIGLSRNRLPAESDIRDVEDSDVRQLRHCSEFAAAGRRAIEGGEVAVMSLAGGVGSRWTRGAGVIKALSPFVLMAGRHRSFLEIHLAKSRKTASLYGSMLPHIVSTSFLTHAPVEHYLEQAHNFGWEGPLYVSPGKSIGQRLIPMARDLVFLWEEQPQAVLDEQKQKVQDSVRAALVQWAKAAGEGSDYADNVPSQCFNPPGHWYEAPNLIRNGVLLRLLREHPEVKTLMLHNIDTLGADLDPAALGAHLASGNMLTYEVVPRRIDDRGGGLARVNGRVRLLEGLAQPREDVELRLRYYNSLTTWIQTDEFLALFGLTREDLDKPDEELAEAVRKIANRLPTYVTIKDVKYRWGHGQEDVYPVTQFEKLWGDMTALPDVSCGYLAVDRLRGQQLKDPDELDAWSQDGSREHVQSLCDFA